MTCSDWESNLFTNECGCVGKSNGFGKTGLSGSLIARKTGGRRQDNRMQEPRRTGDWRRRHGKKETGDLDAHNKVRHESREECTMY